MKTAYQATCEELQRAPKTWLVTGVAGFIGSNLLEQLLALGQRVVGLDNFSTGHRHNLEDVRAAVGEAVWQRFRLIEGDIKSPADCSAACAETDYVLHQAALGSVPRSIADPATTHHTNVTGFVNMLVAARESQVQKFVYASSSSVYGDHPGLPKVEAHVGKVLSPYAASKYANEVYADAFANSYQLQLTGLRYFNVFGPRQDPLGAYAAVIPKWIGQLLQRQRCQIYGDGETSRDFTYVANVVQANLLAATADSTADHQVFNIACGSRMTLNELYAAIESAIRGWVVDGTALSPERADFRQGDVRHSHADIALARMQLGYQPTHDAASGLTATVSWYARANCPDRPKAQDAAA